MIIENGIIKKDEIDFDSSNIANQIVVVDYNSSESIVKKLGLDAEKILELMKNTFAIYENHEDFDLIGINILNHKGHYANRVCIYLCENKIVLLCKDVVAVEKIINEFRTNNAFYFNRFLSSFFEMIIVNDVNHLDNIEQEISGLESALITSKKRNCVKEIISLRKRLMGLKRYYEQMIYVLENLQENENKVFQAESVKYFNNTTGRVERLFNNVQNLRDYVTQVREAYQAEVDISLNSIMKIFTVITAIFLPLTLIVGWYGMNLQMPEYQWSFAYPVVIIISLLVVVFCILYFKKHKWY